GSAPDVEARRSPGHPRPVKSSVRKSSRALRRSLARLQRSAVASVTGKKRVPGDRSQRRFAGKTKPAFSNGVRDGNKIIVRAGASVSACSEKARCAAHQSVAQVTMVLQSGQ